MKILELAKKHPKVTILTTTVAILGALNTIFDFRDKICAHLECKLFPELIDNSISNIWTNVSSKEIQKKFGCPTLTAQFSGREYWFYKGLSCYLAMSFNSSNFINDFVICVKDPDRFPGYKLPEEYGDFTLGKDKMNSSEHFSLHSISAGIGARVGFVEGLIDPPYILRRAGFWETVKLRAFEALNGEEFGYAVLSIDSVEILNNC